ncbi:hypothetical protein MNEG_4688 [Monoraphidium neglectum]|uniref:Uncharacterized protein n=1 Tax=Monoraphidium neglectum TaxID=145388 RepID=A0A0D2MJV5_9CHLO|nr:hypothetical protein MNEG_4688 [Monoraphidium neglectum]KIZ03270.1 hypothetical protein MNEG_4688 [Monoraphidium neglectum]|eukprot:XP_013902289.1 hypothetical protein MNEG_4688 [Monoraphidium neglectum]
MELLIMSRKLHMPGVLEYAEGTLSPMYYPRPPPETRKERWLHILGRERQLMECLAQHVHPPSKEAVADAMVDLHNSLALHPDDMRDFQESPVALDIREGPLTRQQMQLLACVAEAARVLYWMRYKF